MTTRESIESFDRGVECGQYKQICIELREAELEAHRWRMRAINAGAECDVTRWLFDDVMSAQEALEAAKQ